MRLGRVLHRIGKTEASDPVLSLKQKEIRMRGAKPTLLMPIACAALIGVYPCSACRGEEPNQSQPARARVEAARKTYERWSSQFLSGSAQVEGVYRWSHRWVEAELYVSRRR